VVYLAGADPTRRAIQPDGFHPKLPRAGAVVGEESPNELDSVDREDTNVILIVRMEVRSVVRRCRLGEHANDDPEETGDLWHPSSGSPETAELSLVMANEFSHAENSTLRAFTASTCASRYGATRRMQVNA
jgi:hypothetical protein